MWRYGSQFYLTESELVLFPGCQLFSELLALQRFIEIFEDCFMQLQQHLVRGWVKTPINRGGHIYCF